MTTTTPIDQDLEKFMIAWGSTKCSVEKDFIVYKVAPMWGKKAANNANILLRDLGLDDRLEAVPSGLHSDASFSVQIKKK